MADQPGSSAAAGFPIRGWLADCSTQFRDDFLALARPESVARDRIVYRAGDRGQDLFGIRSGVILVQYSVTHPDSVGLHLLRAGEWFGTLEWMSRERRRFSVIARTDVELLRVPGVRMPGLLRHHPEGIARLGWNAGGLEMAVQGAADLLIRDASARCAAVLLRLAGRRLASEPEANLPSEIPATQAELAMNCNVSRKTFSRVVGEFSGAGLVSIGYKWLTVEDPARLRALAEGD